MTRTVGRTVLSVETVERSTLAGGRSRKASGTATLYRVMAVRSGRSHILADFDMLSRAEAFVSLWREEYGF